MDMAFGPPVDLDALGSSVVEMRPPDNGDFCEVRYASGEVDRFIRCVLALPVPRLNSEFRFGVWMSVSQRTWDIYGDGFETENYAEDVCFGYLMHDIADYPGSRLLHADIVLYNNGKRPLVRLHDADHPLVRAQSEGVDLPQIERWVAQSHRR